MKRGTAMAGNIEIDGGRRGIPWRIVGWSVPLLLLLLPLAANAPWTLTDFIFMGLLFVIVGLLLELAVRASGNIFYRAGAGVAVAASFLLIWVNGAVGFLGNEDNPANLMFAGVLLIAVLGSVLARFKPAGMARAMLATAAGQALVGMIALAAGLGSVELSDRLYEVVMGTSLFAALWLMSAGLFRKAAGEQISTAGAR